ncbi:MAG: hypothetical protein JO037_04825 [Actinobacteria bacterium]|nr:hypothetical protein [Actinomycetota bacterium]
MTAPDHSGLPLRDYDHLPLSSLAQRSLTGRLISGQVSRPAGRQPGRSRLPWP